MAIFRQLLMRSGVRPDGIEVSASLLEARILFQSENDSRSSAISELPRSTSALRMQHQHVFHSIMQPIEFNCYYLSAASTGPRLPSQAYLRLPKVSHPLFDICSKFRIWVDVP